MRPGERGAPETARAWVGLPGRMWSALVRSKARRLGERLIEAADLSRKPSERDRALRLARAALKAGAEVNFIGGLNPASALHRAASHNDARLCEELIKAGANVDALDGMRQTALQLAVADSGLESVMALLKAGANPNKAANANGLSPLHLAASRESIALAAALSAFGARVGQDAVGREPLHYARQMDICRLLLEMGADPQARDKKGMTALEFARNYKFGAEAIEAHEELARVAAARKEADEIEGQMERRPKGASLGGRARL